MLTGYFPPTSHGTGSEPDADRVRCKALERVHHIRARRLRAARHCQAASGLEARGRDHQPGLPHQGGDHALRVHIWSSGGRLDEGECMLA